MAMSMEEVEAMIADRPDRTPIICHEEGDEFVATYEGQEFRAGNPFGLDSKLSYAGVPQPRDLYLLEAAARVGEESR